MNINILRAIFAGGLMVYSTAAWCGGFEKAVMWSGRYAGFGNAATSVVDNSEALYFNPAGLGAVHGMDLSLNFSPTFSQFKGPITSADTQVTSNRSFSPPFGATAAVSLSEKLGVGLGVFVSGGTKAVYEDVDFSGVNAAFAQLKPLVKSDLSITEVSLGAGYELCPGLRVGAAWRVSLVRASLSSATASAAAAPATPALLTEVSINDITATKFNGARVGLQYAPAEGRWGAGVNWRSPVSFAAKGTSSGRIVTGLGGASSTLTGGDALVSSTFPQQLAVAGHYDVLPKEWRALFEYDWTQYNVDRTLDISGGITLPTALGGTNRAVPSIDQSWKNQNNFRFGTEYNGLLSNLALRAGYVLTTAVVPAKAARATFSSPGLGHTFTIGAGTRLLDNALSLNGAFEYSTASGSVSSSDQTLSGDYSSNGYSIHAGVEYRL